MKREEPPIGDVPQLSADDLYAERVREARQQPLGEKLLAGVELFVLSCEFMRAGIRIQHPDADAAQVEAMLQERLALARKLENGA